MCLRGLEFETTTELCKDDQLVLYAVVSFILAASDSCVSYCNLICLFNYINTLHVIYCYILPFLTSSTNRL